METNPTFVEEIDFKELQFLEIVGRGAFGIVKRAKWRNADVAVKAIETEAEKKAFITELKQLSRVNHPNIIKLYGACTNSPVCLVMEYAEGGSLYNVLHGESIENLPSYTAAHAMSWALQCARGVCYLHGMKPKPLVHRDLKPPNLLLINGGKVLKICDFGTACDAHTHMTNNKGSAAWMAPEVFEGNNYSEKCDVFSWGIILWEVLTRKKPFDEIGGPAFRIMWAVHNGTRPPIIAGCPKPINALMTRCWSSNPCERPSMSEVERVMTHLFQHFEGADVPLHYPGYDHRGVPLTESSYTNVSQGGSTGQGHTIRETVRNALSQMGEPVAVPIIAYKPKPIVVQVQDERRTSAPASLAASRESLLDGTRGSRSSTPSYDIIKRYSADLSKLEELDYMKNAAATTSSSENKKPVLGHRRSGSYGNSSNMLGPNWQPKQGRGHTRTGSHGSSSIVLEPELHHAATAPGQLSKEGGSETENDNKTILHSNSWAPGNPEPQPHGITPHVQDVVYNDPAWNMLITAMDHQLQPLPPCPTNDQSVHIYKQHCEYAMEYLRVQTEIYLLKQREQELEKELQVEEPEDGSTRLIEEFQQLMSENDSLGLLLKNLKSQVQQIKESREAQ